MLRILEFEPYFAFAFETEVVFVSIRAYIDDIVAIVEPRNIRFPTNAKKPSVCHYPHYHFIQAKMSSAVTPSGFHGDALEP